MTKDVAFQNGYEKTQLVKSYVSKGLVQGSQKLGLVKSFVLGVVAAVKESK